MPYYIFAWITNILYGLGTISSKLSSKHQLNNPWLLNYVLGFLITLFIVPFALYYGIRLPVHWGPLWLAGLFSMLAGTLYVLAMYKLDISILSPLYAFRSVFSVLLGYIFFRELLTTTQLLFVLLMVIAGLFVSIDEHFRPESFFRPGVLLAMSAILCSAVYSATIKYALQYEGFWEVTLWNNIFGMVITSVTIPLFLKDIRDIRIPKYGGVLLSAVFYTAGSVAANAAFSTNIGLTGAILAVPMAMIFAFVFSVIAPRLLEKHTMKIYAIRFSAAAVMVFAAIRLSG